MPRKFDSGVLWYTRATAVFSFPEDCVVCRYCPLFKTEYGTRRDYCSLTGNALRDPDREIDGMCPLILEELRPKEESDAEPNPS